MKKQIVLFLMGIIFLVPSFLTGQNKIAVFEEILFYDGYNTLEKLENEIVPVPEGVYRLKTSVVTTKLTEEQLALFGDTIEMEVMVKAACDNYDRLGHVHLALVSKDSTSYPSSSGGVERIELARFITPFMNKNRQPNTVPYRFDVNYLKHIFKDKDLLEKYDFWMELEIFGVPYAANDQVSGCKGRNDVFYGSLSFITSDSIARQEGNVLIPILHKFSLRSYNENGTDELYETRKSAEITIEEDLPNCKLVLITSNHGANQGGEEYSRRRHFVYFNDALVLNYKPGRKSCEEFRKYNTQGNGIYGSSAKTDEQWQSFSNWCPGDVIDTRVIELGEVTAGTHTFTIDVPDAVFADREGYFPLSLYFLSTNAKTDEDYLEVSDTAILLHSDDLKRYVQVKSNTDWIVTSEATWLTVEPVSESGSMALAFSAGSTNVQRTATVDVSNGDTTITITVTQDIYYLKTDKSVIHIPAEGSTETFQLLSNLTKGIGYNHNEFVSVKLSSSPMTLTVGKNPTNEIRMGVLGFTATGFDEISIKIFQEAAPISLTDMTVDNQVIIHPNPANTILNINASSQINKIEMYSISGQLIYTDRVGNSNVSVNTSGFAQGLYIVKVYTENGQTTQKISILK